MHPLLTVLLLFIFEKRETPLFREIKKSYLEIQADRAISAEEKVKAAIFHYFKLRYEVLRLGAPLNFNFLLKPNEEVLSRLAFELENARKNDLGFHDYDFSLELKYLEMGSASARATVLESHYAAYNAFPDVTSRLKNLKHKFLLNKYRNNWIIAEDSVEDLLAISAGKANLSIVDFLKKHWHISRTDAGKEHPQKAPPLSRGYYDRQAAVSYAHTWALRYNPAYANFTPWGGDCTNFASQVIHAGGKQMDFTPPHKWYYRDMYDRTPSWAGVDEIYSYLTQNTSGGAAASVVPLEEVEPGDVVQLDFDDSTWDYNHSPVVVKVIERGNPAKILMAAHTDNRDNYPLINYGYRRVRPLKIT